MGPPVPITARMHSTSQRPFPFSQPVSSSPLSPTSLPFGPASITRKSVCLAVLHRLYTSCSSSLAYVLYRAGTIRLDHIGEEGAEEEYFDCKGQTMSVAEYYRDKLGQNVRYGFMPTLRVKNNKGSYPLEYLRIAPKQRFCKTLTGPQVREYRPMPRVGPLLTPS
eukprot:1196352-Prorocentrum_minimum.AAC.9